MKTWSMGTRTARIGLATAMAMLATGFETQAIDPTVTQNVWIEGFPFAIPKDCTLEQVATPELCTWPIVATWDGSGNLMVAESVWNGESVQDQLKSRPHRIIRLSDSDQDGRFDRRQVVAESLSFPEGLLCLGNDLLVSAPPEIWRLSDADGDGVYESRDVWFDGTTLTHCANDLHGPWLGPDGWVYWSKSAFAEQSHATLEGTVLKSSASHLYRRHPSGGPIEPVMTGGMDNLVDVAWLANGEPFFCATFLHHPRHTFRDGIGHAMYGSVFGKPHAVLDGHRRTGPLMEPVVELGPAAPAGLLHLPAVCNELASALPSPAWTDDFGYFVSAQFNLHKIGLHKLSGLRSEAGYTAESIDLLSSPRIDFHPVDVLLDRDGSLLILDTGGWYDLCCPSSGTDQRVALGGIYRLRGVTHQPSGQQPQEASKRLASSGAVAGTRVPDVAQALVQDSGHQATWDRIMTDLVSNDRDTRTAVMHLVSLYRHQNARNALRPLLESEDAKTVRLAIECMGRIGIRDDDLKRIMAKLESQTSDRSLRHTILFALMEGATLEQLRPYLTTDVPAIAGATAYALEQMHALTASDAAAICALAADEVAAVSEIGLEILAQHPEWSDHAIGWLKDQYAAIRSSPLAEPPTKPLATIFSRWSQQTSVQQLVKELLDQSAVASASQQTCLLETLAGMGGRSVPPSWELPLARWVGTVNEQIQPRLADTLAGLQMNGSESELVAAIEGKLKERSDDEPDGWLSWARCLPVGNTLPIAKELPLVENCLDGQAETRKLALTTLQRIRLSEPASIEALLHGLDRLSPLELPVALDALLRDNSPKTDLRLLDRLRQVDTAKTLDVESSLARLRGRDPSVLAEWRDTLQSLQRSPDNIVADVDRWLKVLPVGDARQGYQVFRSDKAACSACHRIGYVGGNIGPVLSQIGQTRARRELLEAIVYPSARLEQSYRPIKVRTLEGEVYNGLVIEETPIELQLQLAADRQVRIAIDTIEVREPSQVSIMPAGLDQQLSQQELADLLAFLENAK